MILDFFCPACLAFNSVEYDDDDEIITDMVPCSACRELWGIEIDIEDVRFFPTGRPVNCDHALHDSGNEEESLEIFENPLSDTCEACGMTYDKFRTGENYQSIVDTLWVGSEDPSDWNYKRRGTVLGRWHALKQELWRDHLEQCEGEGEDIYEDEDFILSDY